MGFDNVNVNVSGPVQPSSTYKTKVLKGNHSFASQVTEPNMKYVIKYDFVLDSDVTIPANCVLEFDGGSVSGDYAITGSNTQIKAGIYKIIDANTTLRRTWNILEVYAEWFGAIGNGITDDYNALQAALDFTVLTKSRLKLLEKTYYISSCIKDVSDNTYNDRPGYSIEGVSTKTILTRGIDTVSDLVPNYASQLDVQACLCVRSSNNIIKNISFYNSKIGLYVGHDYTSAEKTSASFNTIENLYMKNVGAGLVLNVFGTDSGYYNRFYNIHIQQCNIGVYIPNESGTASQANRNTFLSVRVNRAIVGYAIIGGSTNTFLACHAEGIATDATSVVGTIPSFLDIVKATAFVLESGARYTRLISCIDENVESDLYHNADNVLYVGCLFQVDSRNVNHDVVIFKNDKYQYIDNNSYKLHGLTWQSSGGALNPLSPNAGLTKTEYIYDANTPKTFNKNSFVIIGDGSRYSTSTTKISYYCIDGFCHYLIRIRLEFSEVSTNPIYIRFDFSKDKLTVDDAEIGTSRNRIAKTISVDGVSVPCCIVDGADIEGGDSNFYYFKIEPNTQWRAANNNYVYGNIQFVASAPSEETT